MGGRHTQEGDCCGRRRERGRWSGCGEFREELFEACLWSEGDVLGYVHVGGFYLNWL